MTYLEDVLEATTRFARTWRALFGSGEADAMNWIEIHRGNEPHLAIAWNQDAARGNLQVEDLASDLEADLAVAIADVYVPRIAHNPITGQPWAPREVRDVRLNSNGIENGWIGDALFVYAANRDGELGVRFLPYELDEGRIVWLDADDELHQVLALQHEPLVGNLYGALLDNRYRYNTAAEQVRTQAELDVARRNGLIPEVDAGAVVILAKPGTSRHQQLRKHLPPREITNSTDWLTKPRELYGIRPR